MSIGPGSRGFGVVLAAAALLCACALPAEQLVLPSPVEPAKGPSPHHAGRGHGVPLGAEATGEAGETRTWRGSGELAADPQPALKPIATADAGKDGITLSLVDATIPEAAKTILGDVLKVNYIVSDKLRGSLTLQTTRPVPRDVLVEIFEAALRMEGAAIVVEGQLYRVVPVAEGLAHGTPLRGSRPGGRRVPGLATQVVPLEHVAAPEMERILKSLSPQGGVLRADAQRNLLVLSGNRAELAAMHEAIAVFDVDWMRGMSFGLFPIETGDVEAIAQELDTVFANDRDGPTRGMVRFVPNKRLKSVLVITARPEYLRKAETWIRRIDLVGKASEREVQVYHVQSRPAAELALLLQKVYASQEQGRLSVSRGGPGGAVGLVTGALPGQSASGPALPPTVFQAVPGVPSAPAGTVAVPAFPVPSGGPGNAAAHNSAPAPLPTNEPALGAAPAPALASDHATGSTRPLSASGAPPDDRHGGIAIVADEGNNTLIITATQAEWHRIRRILARIDIMPSQVLLEATVAEVSLNDQLKMGLRWFFQRGQSQFKLSDSTAGLVVPSFPGFSYFLNAANVDVVLNALSSVTDVNVIASPSLMVLDNKKAVLQVGDEVPIATQQAVSVLTPGAPIVNSITFRNTGIILSITPRISDGGRVLLDIEQEKSDAVATKTSTLDSPTIQQRRVKTTVSVNDGESLVLAGLMQDKATVGKDQVPLLGNLPLLGNVFKHKTDTIERTELLIAITPRIVKDAHQARAITAEFRDKLNFSTRPQRQGPPDRREQVDRIKR